MAIGHQSFYQTALTSAINSTDLIIPLDTVPTVSEGFLVIESTVEAKREIIYYTSKDATTVTCPSGAGNGRGYDGTTAVSHTQGAAVIMAPVGVMFEKFGTVSLGGINDTNGNELLKVTATASAVNELTLANAATGNAPVLSATGGDTNIDMTLTPKGTGYVNLNYTGAPVQTVSVNYSAVATGTTVIPEDDTIPQNTEGTEFMTLSITPKSATNILVVESITYLSCSVTSSLVAALFKDSGADALAVGQNFMSTATGRVTIPVRHAVVAGSTSAQTFKIRGGSTSAGTTTFNGSAGNRQYGATTKSSIVITEYKAS